MPVYHYLTMEIIYHGKLKQGKKGLELLEQTSSPFAGEVKS